MKCRTGLAILFAFAILAVSCSRDIHGQNVASILSTDLSESMDPDDWFDTFLFLKSEHLHPAGIVLADYATDSVDSLARRLAEISGTPDIPIIRGVKNAEGMNQGKISASQYHDGADFILETMRWSEGKIRLIAVGSLRNEALALSKDPELFLSKIDRIVFVSSPLHGEYAINYERDTVAAAFVYNNGVRIQFIPALRQKLNGKMESDIANCDTDICRFLTERLAVWRSYKEIKEPGFLERTQQAKGQGKNLWSLPAFIPEGMEHEYGIENMPCVVSTDPRMRNVYRPDPHGKDLLMIQWNEKALLSYAMKIIMSEK